jgi:ferredoxin
MAMGLRHVYVLQSVGSNLLQMRKGILKGLEYSGPALFSVYSGAAALPAELPPYLNAAAAMQSRAFSAFCYDPAAGPDGASRFSLESNPEADRDWTKQSLLYEDETHQSVKENVAFTFVDFLACDPRYAAHFAKVTRAAWNERMIPVADYLSGGMRSGDERVPYVLLVDHNDVLHRVIVDDRLIRAAQRCRDMWHGLQELGGIHNSHAERLLVREKKAWDEQKQRELKALRMEPRRAEQVSSASAAPAQTPATPSPAPTLATPLQAEPAPEEKSRDEPYIETPRCTSCDECTQISNTLFAYDANKQAYIANLDAGTYRQLVEAAESCQVSIIHPGKPRNPDEPGLEELLQRAEPFL